MNIISDDSILKGALDELGQTAKQTVKQVANLPLDAAKDAGKQTGAAKNVSEEEVVAEENKKNPPAGGEKKQWQSNDERVSFLKSLYGGSSGEKKPSEFEEQIKDEDPDKQKELIELRNKLHKENYYEPTFNKPPQKAEERPAEKVENEKKQEMQDLEQKDAKKPPPLAVVRERNKAEMFRGTSG